MKSVKVFILCAMRPASCHGLPSSPPPRMCAIATTTPRSSSESRFDEKVTGNGYPYDPYPSSRQGAVPSAGQVATADQRNRNQRPVGAPCASSRSETNRAASYPPTTSCCLSRMRSRGVEIVVVHRGRRHQRLVADPDHRRHPIPDWRAGTPRTPAPETSIRCRAVPVDPRHRQVRDAAARARSRSSASQSSRCPSSITSVAMRHAIPRSVSARTSSTGARGEPEVPAGVVDPEDEGRYDRRPRVMVDVVLDFRHARQQHPPFSCPDAAGSTRHSLVVWLPLCSTSHAAAPRAPDLQPRTPRPAPRAPARRRPFAEPMAPELVRPLGRRRPRPCRTVRDRRRSRPPTSPARGGSPAVLPCRRSLMTRVYCRNPVSSVL